MEWVAGALPEPDADQVRVRVEAAGVSAYDVRLRGHWFVGFPSLPCPPGEDFVGIFDKCGSDVTDLRPGQRVGGWNFGDAGTYADCLCRPAAQLVPVPDGLDPDDAVALIVNYLTAGLALHQSAKAKRAGQLLRSWRALRPGGRLVMLGMAGSLQAGIGNILPSFLVLRLLSIWPGGRRVVKGPGMETYPKAHPDWYGQTLAGFFELAVRGRLTPRVAERIPLRDAARAHALLEGGSVSGKIVLLPDHGARTEPERTERTAALNGSAP